MIEEGSLWMMYFYSLKAHFKLSFYYRRNLCYLFTSFYKNWKHVVWSELHVYNIQKGPWDLQRKRAALTAILESIRALPCLIQGCLFLSFKGMFCVCVSNYLCVLLIVLHRWQHTCHVLYYALDFLFVVFEIIVELHCSARNEAWSMYSLLEIVASLTWF